MNEIYIILLNQKYQPHIRAPSAPRYTDRVNTIYSYAYWTLHHLHIVIIETISNLI